MDKAVHKPVNEIVDNSAPTPENPASENPALLTRLRTINSQLPEVTTEAQPSGLWITRSPSGLPHKKAPASGGTQHQGSLRSPAGCATDAARSQSKKAPASGGTQHRAAEPPVRPPAAGLGEPRCQTRNRMSTTRKAPLMTHRSRSVLGSRQSRDAMRNSTLRARVAQDLADTEAIPLEPTADVAAMMRKRRLALLKGPDLHLGARRNEGGALLHIVVPGREAAGEWIAPGAMYSTERGKATVVTLGPDGPVIGEVTEVRNGPDGPIVGVAITDSEVAANLQARSVDGYSLVSLAPAVPAPTSHALTSDHNGEPVCSCGYDPARVGARSRFAAVSLVHQHVASWLDVDVTTTDEALVTNVDVDPSVFERAMSTRDAIVSGSVTKKAPSVPTPAGDVSSLAGSVALGSVALDSSPVARLAELAQVASPEGDYAWTVFAAENPATTWLAFRAGLTAAARWEARA